MKGNRKRRMRRGGRGGKENSSCPEKLKGEGRAAAVSKGWGENEREIEEGKQIQGPKGERPKEGIEGKQRKKEDRNA